MEFKVDENTVSKPKKNLYKIDLEFMLKDGDDYETISLYIPKDFFESHNEELSDFVESIFSCIKNDSCGRYGLRSSSQLIAEYSNIKNWQTFCKDSNKFDPLKDKESSKYLSYSIPEMDGWYYSYNDIHIYYYDENGLNYNISILEK